MRLEGVIVPLLAPLTSGYDFDGEAHGRLLEYVCAAGVNGIFVNGSMGAFALLPDATQLRAIEASAEVLHGRLPLLVGISDTGTLRVKERLRSLRHLPVDYFVVLPPYYFAVTQRELLHFYQEIADTATRPVVLYSNPARVSNRLALETVVELASHPNIAAIKESSSDVEQWRELLEAPIDRSRFSFICGAGRVTDTALAMGFDGITEGLHNIVPHLAVGLYQASLAGDHATAAAFQAKISRAFRIFELDGGWRGSEAALSLLGIPTHTAPPPYDIPMDPAHRQEIQRILVEVGALAA